MVLPGRGTQEGKAHPEGGNTHPYSPSRGTDAGSRLTCLLSAVQYWHIAHPLARVLCAGTGVGYRPTLTCGLACRATEQRIGCAVCGTELRCAVLGDGADDQDDDPAAHGE
eukprot:2642004-Rhodomonas_salina.8